MGSYIKNKIFFEDKNVKIEEREDSSRAFVLEKLGLMFVLDEKN